MAKITTKPAATVNEESVTIDVSASNVESPESSDSPQTSVAKGRPRKPAGPQFQWNDDLDLALSQAAYDIVHGNRVGGLTAQALTNAITETATNSMEDPSTLALLTDKAVAKRYGQIVRGLAKQGIELPEIEKPSKRHKMDTARLAAIWQGAQASS